jgi:hypothetical protein
MEKPGLIQKIRDYLSGEPAEEPKEPPREPDKIIIRLGEDNGEAKEVLARNFLTPKDVPYRNADGKDAHYVTYKVLGDVVRIEEGKPEKYAKIQIDSASRASVGYNLQCTVSPFERDEIDHLSYDTLKDFWTGVVTKKGKVGDSSVKRVFGREGKFVDGYYPNMIWLLARDADDFHKSNELGDYPEVFFNSQLDMFLPNKLDEITSPENRRAAAEGAAGMIVRFVEAVVPPYERFIKKYREKAAPEFKKREEERQREILRIYKGDC